MALRPPSDHGVTASRLQLPPGSWATIFECLCAHFATIDRETWRARIERGRVLDERGAAITLSSPYRAGQRIHYYREVIDEPRIPFDEAILHLDEHLLVVDKPHFLAVIPAGQHVGETLLARLVRRLGNEDLAPLHRIDRATAGLVLFSSNPASRARYQALFRERRIAKQYEALAPALPALEFPLTRSTRLVRGEPFFRMQEAQGAPNSETRIDVLARGDAAWRYALEPLTGRKHQLRVHMAALGAPILNDDFYPWTDTGSVRVNREPDYSRPLKLLAKTLAFIDPVSGMERRFESRLTL